MVDGRALPTEDRTVDTATVRYIGAVAGVCADAGAAVRTGAVATSAVGGRAERYGGKSYPSGAT